MNNAATAPDFPRPDSSATTSLLETPNQQNDGPKERRPAKDRSPLRSTAQDSAAPDNRAAESPTSDGGSRPLPSAPVLNLYQRLLAIQGEVDHIKATGKTAYNQRAISIEDVEDALGDLFQKHRVVTGFAYNNPPSIAGNEGKATLWLVDLNVWLVNPDDPIDRIEDRACDVGTSPSAGVSFAIKRYYKALFHLADEEDETRAAGARPNTAQADATATAHLTADELAELNRLNQRCPAPVPDGLAWNSMLKGRDYATLKGMLEKRYTMQTKDEA